MSYCTLFWCSMGIYNDPKTRYMFESYDQKLVVFAFYVPFRELLHTCLGLHGDLCGPLDTMHVSGDDQIFVVFVLMTIFVSYCHISRVSGRFTTTNRPDTCLRA